MKSGYLVLGIILFLLVVPLISAKTDTEKLDDILLKNQDLDKKLDSILKSTQSNINVFGTEYQVGDDTKTFIQLLQDEATPINNATCFLTYWYPDNSVWLSNQLMTYLPTSNGLYYYDSIAQTQTGVYMIDAYCQYTTQAIPYNATGVIVKNGTIISGNNFSVSQSDDDRFVITEEGLTATNGTIFPMLQFKFDETSGNVTLEEVSGTFQNVFGNPNLAVTGISNTGIDFDGVDDYIVINNTGEYNFNATEDIVVCLAIKTDGDFPNNDFVIDMKDGGGEGWEIRGADDQLRFSTDRAGSGNKNHETLFNFNDFNFHTYCGLSSFEEMVSYVDGVFDRQTTPAQSGEMNTTEGYRVGTDSTNSDYTEEILDELCVFRGVNLNISAIATQYNTSRSCDGIGTSTDKISLEVTIGNVTFSNDSNGFSISTEYQWSDLTENLNVHVYNYSASSYVLLSNQLIYSATDNIITSLFNGNYTDFISGNNVLVKYNGTTINDSFKGTLRIDQTKILFHVFIDSPIDEIRGGGELHVTEYNFSKLNTIASDVWTYSDRQLTAFNFDVVNETEIAESVWSFNGTIVSNILDQFAASIWSYVNRTLSSFEFTVNTTVNNSAIVEEVWNYSIREITDTQESWVGGTEYSPEEQTGKVVVRVLDQSGDPVTGATCNFSVFYPNNTIFIDQQGMTEATGVNISGIYYVDFNLSSTVGVYPYGVDCVKGGKDYFMLNTFHVFDTNRTGLINDVWNFENRTLTEFPTFNFSTNISVNVSTNVTVNITTDDLNLTEISYAVWTHTPDRNLTFYPAQLDLTNYTLLQDLITQYSNNITTDDIWNFANRTLTEFPTVNATINLTELTNAVWSATDRNLTFSPQQVDLTNYTLMEEIVTEFGNNLTAAIVWNYFNRTLTDFGFTVNTTVFINTTEISDAVWSATDRNLTFYQDFGDQTNYTLINELILNNSNNITAADIWGYVNRSLTDFDFTVNATIAFNESDIAQQVWNYTNRQLTEFNFDVVNETLISDTIWSAVNRTLTNFNFTVTLNNSELVNDIWSAIDRNLTFYQDFGDQTNYSQITDIVISNGNNLTAADIWNYVNRSLTEFNFTVETTVNVSEISESVWNYVERNLTTTEDLTNYSLIQMLVWNATTRTLTNFNFTVDVDFDEIAETVWEYNNRTLTDFNFTVTTDVNLTEINFTQLTEQIWSYEGNVSNNLITKFGDYVICSISELININDGGWGISIANCLP